MPGWAATNLQLSKPASIHPADVAELLARIHSVIRQPRECLGHQLTTDASIGIAHAPSDGTEPEELMKNADLALYRAKSQGAGLPLLRAGDGDGARRAAPLENDLRSAVADGGFEVHFQPLVDPSSKEESPALRRWRAGAIRPAAWCRPPISSRSPRRSASSALGEWVLGEACAQAARWPRELSLAVNLSPAQFKSGDLAGVVSRALARSGLPAPRLELEITEA